MASVVRTPIDRSLAFTALLELSPEFRRMESRKGSKAITRFLEAFHGQETDYWFAKPCNCQWTCCPHCPHWPAEHPRPVLNMFEYARAWLAQGGLDEEGGSDATGQGD